MPTKKLSFNELLMRWNKGIKRGSQLRLSKLLGINEATVSRWVSGEVMPGEETLKKIAREFGLTPEELMDSLKPLGYRDTQERILLDMLDPEEQEMFKKICKDQIRGPVEAFRSLVRKEHGHAAPAGSPEKSTVHLGPVDRILPVAMPDQDAEKDSAKDQTKKSVHGNK